MGGGRRLVATAYTLLVPTLPGASGGGAGPMPSAGTLFGAPYSGGAGQYACLGNGLLAVRISRKEEKGVCDEKREPQASESPW